MSLSRVLFGVLLAVNLAALGFTLGAFGSAVYLAPAVDGVPKEGLVGGALVMIYGSAGALAGLILGGILVWKVPADKLMPVTLGAIMASGIFISLLLWRAGRL